MATLAIPCTTEDARHLHAHGQLLAAAQAYRQTLEQSPRDHQSLLGLSLIARQTQQLEPALRMAEAAVATHPHSALAWANLGDCLTVLGATAPAKAAFEHALTLAPENDPALTPAHYGLGNALAHQEDFTAALTHFTRAASLTPHSPECHFAQGFTHGKLAQHRHAVEAYRRAIRLRPSFASAWLNLGVELIADGRDALAAPCYRQALNTADTPSTRISAHLNLGHLARSHRRFSPAQTHYEHALQLAQSSCPTRLSEVHVAFAYLHLEQQQFPQAWQSLRAAEASDAAPSNPEISNARGILLLAEEALEPHNPERVPQVSILRPGILRPGIEEAVAAFYHAESQGHKTAASNRGNALLRQGRIPEALAAHQALTPARPPPPRRPLQSGPNPAPRRQLHRRLAQLRNPLAVPRSPSPPAPLLSTPLARRKSFQTIQSGIVQPGITHTAPLRRTGPRRHHPVHPLSAASSQAPPRHPPSSSKSNLRSSTCSLPASRLPTSSSSPAADPSQPSHTTVR